LTVLIEAETASPSACAGALRQNCAQGTPVNGLRSVPPQLAIAHDAPSP
jgi:hypothetical protein